MPALWLPASICHALKNGCLHCLDLLGLSSSNTATAITRQQLLLRLLRLLSSDMVVGGIYRAQGGAKSWVVSPPIIGLEPPRDSDNDPIRAPDLSVVWLDVKMSAGRVNRPACFPILTSKIRPIKPPVNSVQNDNHRIKPLQYKYL